MHLYGSCIKVENVEEHVFFCLHRIVYTHIQVECALVFVCILSCRWIVGGRSCKLLDRSRIRAYHAILFGLCWIDLIFLLRIIWYSSKLATIDKRMSNLSKWQMLFWILHAHRRPWCVLCLCVCVGVKMYVSTCCNWAIVDIFHYNKAVCTPNSIRTNWSVNSVWMDIRSSKNWKLTDSTVFSLYTLCVVYSNELCGTIWYVQPRNVFELLLFLRCFWRFTFNRHGWTRLIFNLFSQNVVLFSTILFQ